MKKNYKIVRYVGSAFCSLLGRRRGKERIRFRSVFPFLKQAELFKTPSESWNLLSSVVRGPFCIFHISFQTRLESIGDGEWHGGGVMSTECLLLLWNFLRRV